MRIHVNPGDTLPIYAQIVRQVVDAIAGGALRPGDRLASQRALAAQLVVAPLTVKKAYDELERRGHVATQHGRGTFVSDAARRLPERARVARVRPAARRLVRQAAAVGLSLRALNALLREERARLKEGKHARS